MRVRRELALKCASNRSGIARRRIRNYLDEALEPTNTSHDA